MEDGQGRGAVKNFYCFFYFLDYCDDQDHQQNYFQDHHQAEEFYCLFSCHYHQQHHQKDNFAQDLHQNHHQNHPGHLHGLKDVIVSHPGPRLASPLLAGLGPDLVEAGNDERAPAIKQVVKSGQSGQKWLRVALCD